MVLSCFQRGTTEWGHPSRVRADNGGENVTVGEYIVWYRGKNRGSFLTGQSVRNTRIERLWRDAVESVVTIFTSLFLFMENQCILDPGCENDMHALHYVFFTLSSEAFGQIYTKVQYALYIYMRHNRTLHQLWAKTVCSGS